MGQKNVHIFVIISLSLSLVALSYYFNGSIFPLRDKASFLSVFQYSSDTSLKVEDSGRDVGFITDPLHFTGDHREEPSPEKNPWTHVSLMETRSRSYHYAARYHAGDGNDLNSSFRGECYAYSSRAKKALLPREILQEHGCQRRLARAFIIGMKKCGTETLGNYLSLHPAVTVIHQSVTRSQPAIPVIFVRKVVQPYSSPQQLPVAGRPAFVCTPRDKLITFKSLLRDRVGETEETKFVVILRDPVVRALSDYVHKVKILSRDFRTSGTDLPFPINYRGDTILETFEKTVSSSSSSSRTKVNASQTLVKLGVYVKYIRIFLTVFKREQLLLLDGQSFIENPFRTMQQLEHFLGLPKIFLPEHFRRNPKTGFFCPSVPERPDMKCASPSAKGRPHPTVDPDTIDSLRQFYREPNLALARDFGVNFTWLFS